MSDDVVERRSEEMSRPRIAVVSPFLSKEHGTERIVIEWMQQVSAGFEIHVYAQSVEDTGPLDFTFHRIPKLPGPHLVNFIWWFLANHLWRAWDSWFRGLRYDLVYTPGVNCLGADVVSVHIVFGEFLRRVRRELDFKRNPISFWPRLLHRRLYYNLIIWLESVIYTDPDTTLILIAKKTLADLERLYGRHDRCIVLYLGIAHGVYNTTCRTALRAQARNQLALADSQFTLLLVGNDWYNKGIRVLLDALVELRDLPIDLLVAGREDPVPFRKMVLERNLGGTVHFWGPRPDVEFYYAAADVYVGPSLEDTFALPPAEAMACGLPVIVTRENGVHEIMTDGVDGLILEDPQDAAGLAAMIRRLRADKEFRDRMGERAAETARKYTWESNGRELTAVFQEILRRKSALPKQTLTQQS